jgi:hypothetical protein
MESIKSKMTDPGIQSAIRRDAIFDDMMDLADKAQSQEARRIIRQAARQWRADYIPTN